MLSISNYWVTVEEGLSVGPWRNPFKILFTDVTIRTISNQNNFTNIHQQRLIDLHEKHSRIEYVYTICAHESKLWHSQLISDISIYWVLIFPEQKNWNFAINLLKLKWNWTELDRLFVIICMYIFGFIRFCVLKLNM